MFSRGRERVHWEQIIPLRLSSLLGCFNRVRNRLQILLLILIEFKRIDFYSPGNYTVGFLMI